MFGKGYPVCYKLNSLLLQPHAPFPEFPPTSHSGHCVPVLSQHIRPALLETMASVRRVSAGVVGLVRGCWLAGSAKATAPYAAGAGSTTTRTTRSSSDCSAGSVPEPVRSALKRLCLVGRPLANDTTLRKPRLFYQPKAVVVTTGGGGATHQWLLSTPGVSASCMSHWPSFGATHTHNPKNTCSHAG